MDKANNLIWIDLEMTGLQPETHVIIEIATLVTDSALNILAEGPNLVVHAPENELAKMGEWCIKQHGESGLTQAVRQSQISVSQAEEETLAFLKQYTVKGKSPMCGNSICMDRRFLYEYMPKLEGYFHYRHLDVSTLKELAKRWRPDIYNQIKKETGHRALGDIKESIEELKLYRDQFLRMRG